MRIYTINGTEPNLLPITKVIFIDDSKNNLESVEIAANKIGINFYGYHFHKKTHLK